MSTSQMKKPGHMPQRHSGGGDGDLIERLLEVLKEPVSNIDRIFEARVTDVLGTDSGEDWTSEDYFVTDIVTEVGSPE